MFGRIFLVNQPMCLFVDVFLKWSSYFRQNFTKLFCFFFEFPDFFPPTGLITVIQRDIPEQLLISSAASIWSRNLLKRGSILTGFTPLRTICWGRRGSGRHLLDLFSPSISSSKHGGAIDHIIWTSCIMGASAGLERRQTNGSNWGRLTFNAAIPDPYLKSWRFR